MQKERFKVIPAVYLMLMQQNKILLLRRFNTGYEDGNYSFVAGHVHAGESFKDAIKREAKEEAGIEIAKEDLCVVHVMHRVGLERMSVFLNAEKWQGEIENKEPHKCDDLSWFELDKLPQNIIPYIRTAIENVQQEVFYSEE